VRTFGCEALGLALALEGCTLRWLRLHKNALGDDGVVHLATALHKNASLTKLQLRDVGLGERGARALMEAIRRGSCTLARLGLEGNSLTSQTTEGLLQAMQASKLDSLSLDGSHGGEFARTFTRDDLRKQLTLSFLGIKLKKGHGTDQMARGYVGKLGVTNPYGAPPR